MVLYCTLMLSIDKYWNLVRKIDQYVSGWTTAPPIPLKCHPGCDECCHAHVTLFAVEVAAINQALRERKALPEESRLNSAGAECPFLEKQRCLIYERRPILCRTQGFPFVYQDEKGKTVSHICSHNRTAQEMSLPSRFVLNLETLNNCLSSLNYLYLAEMEEEGTIVPARLDIVQILDYTVETQGA